MSIFYPSDSNDKISTQAEIDEWNAERAKKIKKEKRGRNRFIVTTVLSGIAALAAVAGAIIQLVSRQ